MAQARRKSRRKPKKRNAGSSLPWIMLLVGLVSGSVLATLYLGAKSGDQFDMGSGLSMLLEREKSVAVTGDARSTSAPDDPPPKANFDFYTVLPEIERVIPDTYDDPDTGAEDQTTKPRAPAHFILQAGSYARLSDADHLKARLVLSGFDTTVQRISIEGKGVYYRVRVGPYSDRRALKNARQRLQKMGIDALPLKVTVAEARQ